MSSSTVGIDVSKAKLDVALLSEQARYKSKVFANTPTGHMALWQWLQVHVPDVAMGMHVCMEATGSYHEPLALYLHDLGVHV
ncbi:MAG: transposase [Hydrogenophaga sp.]|nr:transposase [Hydrogenophaga sp.]